MVGLPDIKFKPFNTLIPHGSLVLLFIFNATIFVQLVFISKWKKESNRVIPIKQVGVQIFFVNL
jgi:hypothetical protein